jgi:pyrroloquinoline-quinone synthase
MAPLDTAVFTADDAYVSRKHIDAGVETFMNEMTNYIINHRALEHPFFNYYAINGLPKEAGKLLYKETRFYFTMLPYYIATIAGLVDTDDAAGNNVLRFIAFNAQDELGEEYAHSDMYKDFMRNYGITDEELSRYRPLPSTTALNEGIRTLYSTRPLVRALGALFADETLSAGLVSKYNEGLEKEGFSAEERYFWTLHCEWEVGHSNAVFNIVEPYLNTPNDYEMFKEGIDQYLYLMEGYWDGIEKLIGYNHVSLQSVTTSS